MSYPHPSEGLPLVKNARDPDCKEKCVHYHGSDGVRTDIQGERIAMCRKCYTWYKKALYKRECQEYIDAREKIKLKVEQETSLALKAIVAQLDKAELATLLFHKEESKTNSLFCQTKDVTTEKSD